MKRGIDFASVVLALLFALPVILIVMLEVGPAVLGYFGQFDLQHKLRAPALSDWHVAASGDVYIFTYPSACGLAQASNTSAGNTVVVACPNVSYAAVLVTKDHADNVVVFCNATLEYKGWITSGGVVGYAYIYDGKALLCKLIPSSGSGGSVVVVPVRVGW
ncbi:MAG: hypothetical protein RXR06_11740 [Thermoproteus sp.]